MASQGLLLLGLFAISCSIALATDPTQIQDFCVAVTNSSVLVNGFVCKDPSLVVASDFKFSGLNVTGNVSNAVGSKVTPVFATELPGLNTMGISVARVDFAPLGLNPPHTHPRATEVFTLLKGTVIAGFVTSNPLNRLFTQVLNEGDVFVFPQGLIHFQHNIGNGVAVAIASLSSENPGIVTIANSMFGSNPKISTDTLEKTFHVDANIIANLTSKFP